MLAEQVRRRRDQDTSSPEADDIGPSIASNVGEPAGIQVLAVPAFAATEVLQIGYRRSESAAARCKSDVETRGAKSDNISFAVVVDVGNQAQKQVIARPAAGCAKIPERLDR